MRKVKLVKECRRTSKSGLSYLWLTYVYSTKPQYPKHQPLFQTHVSLKVNQLFYSCYFKTMLRTSSVKEKMSSLVRQSVGKEGFLHFLQDSWHVVVIKEAICVVQLVLNNAGLAWGWSGGCFATLEATQLFMQMFFYDLVYLLPLKFGGIFFSLTQVIPFRLNIQQRNEPQGFFQVFALTTGAYKISLCKCVFRLLLIQSLYMSSYVFLKVLFISIQLNLCLCKNIGQSLKRNVVNKSLDRTTKSDKARNFHNVKIICFAKESCTPLFLQ